MNPKVRLARSMIDTERHRTLFCMDFRLKEGGFMNRNR